MQARKNRGSALVLVLIALLILSLIGVAALTQSGSEINTSGNFYRDKSTFYAAEAGIQLGIKEIDLNTFNPTLVKFSKTIDIDKNKNTYFTGVLTPSTPQNVTGFLGFKPPPVAGQSIEMNTELNMKYVPWQLIVTAVNNKTRKQIQAIVITMVPEY
jgi:Tfp pilus assembly protein PilX